jgi:MFS transporter, DHA3 family, macrolide efflux protein
VLVAKYGVHHVIMVNAVSFLFPIAGLVLVRFPRSPVVQGSTKAYGLLLHAAISGWKYIASRPGLLGLLVFLAVTSFTFGTVPILIAPLVLSFATPALLGVVLTVGGVGMLLGSLLMAAWGGPKRRIYGVLGFTLLPAVVLLVGGLRPSVWLIAGAAFFFLFANPIIVGSSEAIWQAKVESHIQGRVFALSRMVVAASGPVAFAVTGPLVDYVFEPLLAPNGLLASTVGQVIGVGAGRGIGLMFILLGLLTLAAVVVAFLSPRLRYLEDELPDAFAALTSVTSTGSRRRRPSLTA